MVGTQSSQEGSEGKGIQVGIGLAILCRQHARNREQQSVYELVVHHHKTAVEQIDRHQHGPERTKLLIQKYAFARSDVSLRLSTQAEQVDDDPQVQNQTEQAVLHGNLKIGVVKEEGRLMKVVDPLGQLRLQVAQTPSGERFLQKHVYSGLIHHNPELHRTALFEAG